MTLHQVFGTTTPAEAAAVLAAEWVPIAQPANLEEYALSQVGERLYRLFIHAYTQMQWGRDPRLLPAAILKRLPVRLTYDDAYFSDRYQGLPADGYTALVEVMLEGVPVELGVDYHAHPGRWKARKTVYTGPVDRFFDYEFGRLEYRSLRFEERTIDVADAQGTAVVNYTDGAVPYTRISAPPQSPTIPMPRLRPAAPSSVPRRASHQRAAWTVAATATTAAGSTAGLVDAARLRPGSFGSRSVQVSRSSQRSEPSSTSGPTRCDVPPSRDPGYRPRPRRPAARPRRRCGPVLRPPPRESAPEVHPVARPDRVGDRG